MANNSVVLMDVQRSQNGSYMCQASANGRNISATARLNVLGKKRNM